MILSNKTTSTIVFLIVIAYIALSTLRNIGYIVVVDLELALVLIFIMAITGLFVVAQGPVNRAQSVILSLGLILFVYNAAISNFPGLASIFASYMLASAVLFAVLLGADQKLSVSDARTALKSHPITDVAKLAFISFATLHAISLILIYILAPERTTGLLDDFSQASMFLLIAYGMAYPLIKDKAYFSIFSLVIFTAYFTSFSRTANFLLVIFLSACYLIEYKNGESKRWAKVVGLALLGLALVYVYPTLWDQEAVDRGGLANFSTLNSRTIYWQVAWDAIVQNPIFGTGLGSYTFSGIKQAQPLNTIHFVHNDYLQIWHDLGVIWLTAFVGVFGFIMLKFSPVKFASKADQRIAIDTTNYRQFFDWLILACILLYMGINFLILNLEFQTAIAILIASLVRK